MPAKYSHVKKRSASSRSKKSTDSTRDAVAHLLMKKDLSHIPTAISDLERAIARILLIRYEQDIARLFSTRLYSIALVYLPTFVMRCVNLGGPGWLVHNHENEEIKDFFRSVISMDMRQAGERVATKSVLWSYTALRHFSMSNNVPICHKRGLRSARLLPYYQPLKAHLDALEAMPPASFSKPPHLGSLQEGHEALEDACQLKYGRHPETSNSYPEWGPEWRDKMRLGYEKLSQTLWRVAQEFNVHGYGIVLREKLTTKWCDCGCSTDHLGEVCEKTVREEEEESGVRLGKQREWDGRGSGVHGWETEEEEDIWEVDLDFGGPDADECGECANSELTISELMEWRYLKAEHKKEEGNAAFRKGDYEIAVKFYQSAHEIEPELPHYKLNLAAAYLKLNKWMEAEAACTHALGQHHSSKGYYRRARARRMLNRTPGAIQDLRAVLKMQPNNEEAIRELASILQQTPMVPSNASSSKRDTAPSESNADLLERLGVRRPKQPKPAPFPKTRADERRLKIVTVPAPAAEISEIFCAHPFHRREAPGRPSKPMNIEQLKTETFLYPSWDRYVVKRAD